MHASHVRLAKRGPRLLVQLAGILMIGSLALAACSSAPSSASATATGVVPQTGATSAPTSMATVAATSGATMSASGTASPAGTAAATSSGAYGAGSGTSTTSATGSTSGAGTPSAASTAPSSLALTVKSASVGQYLADEKGMTLYIFKKDTPGVSNCTGQCAGIWPPLVVAKDGKVSLSGGGDSTKLGTITRADGTTQVTYNNQPLYYYVKDKAPGDTTGQSVGGVWFVAQP